MEGTYSTQIFSLAVLLSSMFIYNQMGGIDEAALDRLSLVTEMTKHIHVRASQRQTSAAELGQFSPLFVWLLRDFYLDLTESGRQITPRDYLESALQPVGGSGKAVSERNEIRESIRALFPDRNCFTLVRPLNDEHDLQRLDQIPMDRMRSEFRSGLDTLTKFVFERTRPKQLGPTIMNGPMLAGLTQSFLDALNAGAVPSIATSWQNVEEIECRRAHEMAVENCLRMFDKSTAPDENALQDAHEAALAIYNHEAVGAGAPRLKYERQLMVSLKKQFESLANRMSSHGDLHRSTNSNMDLEPSAPYASASSFPSPAEFQNGEEPSLAYEKLQHISQGGASSSGSFFPKFPFSVSASSKGIGIGLDVASKVFPPALPKSFQPFLPPEVTAVLEKRPSGPYLSQNKIAYQIHGTGAGFSPTSALQGILQKCGIGTTNTTHDITSNKQKHHQADLLDRPTSSRIVEKIRNLDDMLRSLDRCSVIKRFAGDVLRDQDTKSVSDQNRYRQPKPSEILEAPISEQPRNATSGVNKAISRLEFKAQMDKLTGVIEDHWFYGGSKKTGAKKSKEATDISYSTRNNDPHPPQQDVLPSVSNPPTSGPSTSLLEEMLRRVVGLERRLTKRDKQKQAKQKRIVARGRLCVQRPAGKRIASIMQRQCSRSVASINQRLDKHEHGEAVGLSHEETINNGHCRGSHSGNLDSDVQTGKLDHAPSMSPSTMCNQNLVKPGETNESSVVEECVEHRDSVSRSMQQMQDELSTLRKESQFMTQSLEQLQQLFSEQNMEIELCWAAINHLCMDNDTFRDDLRAYHTSLQERSGVSELIKAAAATDMQAIGAVQGHSTPDGTK
ncbi:guanylate-binding protein 1/3/4/7 [Marchantia polymorpha subsp. ruderalis]|uniref:GB1/RHD3-type G domain-containing protein n=2 Tax=Marchantia polymorpha TaxID=3197 RepID=A0AAF6BDR0_MARPO|nr:hypothetical protein MARPO_0197s0019 [Marchantia polymorpha]PTQ27484.1 hypothetical protein MARPO_0197s0019 [Marchantia polymorpha]BBN10143.1 hypothetical protein Mp_5g01250 [Marchantia polymorpha subsp. ruderalis]BBN10144.1 hypothetical protein Mp_5g01250 [Marchantia polymorpha subsp. ruderalis]|eukprot:PTQ27483.1 hypothetical protein MARPO_0197s0019 [Marchantia polymorpha]